MLKTSSGFRVHQQGSFVPGEHSVECEVTSSDLQYVFTTVGTVFYRTCCVIFVEVILEFVIVFGPGGVLTDPA